MTKKEAIRKLVKAAIENKKINNKAVSLGVIKETQASLIKAKAEIDVKGYKRIIDISAIKHTLKKHGNPKTELHRGQIAVTEKDFEKIPLIVKSKNIIYSGKNKIGRDCLLYEAKIGNIFFYIEEIRTGKKQLALNTLFKRK